MLWKARRSRSSSATRAGTEHRRGDRDAHIDDGLLDICIITAGNPLSTMEQVLSALLHREPVHGRSEYFRGRRFWISVPASVGLQLDGSHVKLKDYLAGRDRAALGAGRQSRRGDGDLSVRRDASGGACGHSALLRRPAVRGRLGEGRRGGRTALGPDGLARKADRQAQPVDGCSSRAGRLPCWRSGPNPEGKGACIVAGGSPDKHTGESKPAAVRIDRDTTLVTPAGAPLPPAAAARLTEGSVIVVEGQTEQARCHPGETRRRGGLMGREGVRA